MINEPNWDELWKDKDNGYKEKLAIKHIVAIEAVKYIETIEKVNTIADFGCGYGNVLKELAKENKYNLFAYDQSDFAKQDLEQKGVKFQKCNLLDMKQHNFNHDIAIITDVLEHFFQPRKVLEGLKNCKYIIIVVPNFSELTQRIQVLNGKVPFQMKQKRGGHVFWFNINEFYDICNYDFKIIKEFHSFPNKISKFKFLKRYPGIFANLFAAILVKK
jgi:SAM-dependent methyltransferase